MERLFIQLQMMHKFNPYDWFCCLESQIYERVYSTDVMKSFLQDLGEDPTIDPGVAYIKEIVQIIQAILVLKLFKKCPDKLAPLLLSVYAEWFLLCIIII